MDKLPENIREKIFIETIYPYLELIGEKVEYLPRRDLTSRTRKTNKTR